MTTLMKFLSNPIVLGVLVFVAIALSAAAFGIVMHKRQTTIPTHNTKASFGALIQGPQESPFIGQLDDEYWKNGGDIGVVDNPSVNITNYDENDYVRFSNFTTSATI